MLKFIKLDNLFLNILIKNNLIFEHRYNNMILFTVNNYTINKMFNYKE